MRPLLYCAGILLLGLVVGCSSLQSKDQIARLNERTDDYGTALRWGSYDRAAHFLMPRENAPGPNPVNQDFLNDIRLTTYEITQRVLSTDEKEAVIIAKISYYHGASGTLKTITDRQAWWYHDDTKQWYLDGTLPAFGQNPADPRESGL